MGNHNHLGIKIAPYSTPSVKDSPVDQFLTLLARSQEKAASDAVGATSGPGAVMPLASWPSSPRPPVEEKERAKQESKSAPEEP